MSEKKRPIVRIVSPFISAMLAYECLASCRRTSSSSASARSFCRKSPANASGREGADREDPSGPSWKTVKDIPGRGAQPDRSRSRLAVRQIQVSLAVVAPSKGQDFRLAASGQQFSGRPPRAGDAWARGVRAPRRAPVLPGRQEALHSAPPIAPMLLQGFPLCGRYRLRAVPPGLGLLQDDRQDGHRAVRRPRRGMQRGEPGLDVAMGYLSDPAAFERRAGSACGDRFGSP